MLQKKKRKTSKIMAVSHAFWGLNCCYVLNLEHFVQFLIRIFKCFGIVFSEGTHETIGGKNFDGHINEKLNQTSSTMFFLVTAQRFQRPLWITLNVQNKHTHTTGYRITWRWRWDKMRCVEEKNVANNRCEQC